MKMAQRYPYLAQFVGLLLAGCASTGYVTSERISVPRTVTLQSGIDPEVAPYAPRFVSILTAQGLTVGMSNDPHAMELRLDFNGNPFNLRVGAALWHDGVPILTASATNSGWGTALARGSAVKNLADAALTKFEHEFSQLRPHLQIVDSTESH